jgi:hypothetical protein
MTPLHTLASVGWKDPDIAVSCEARPGPSKHRSGCSQSAIGWSTGLPMEELKKVSKELKGSATLWTNQYPRALHSNCICIKRWPSRPSLEREAHWTGKLYMPQYRETPGPNRGSGWVGEWGWVGMGDFWYSIGNVNELNT